MNILTIESSCDETAAAVISDNCQILSNVVVSQVDIFAAYGGVIPEVAARSHLEAILPVVHKALDDARLTKDNIDYIAVTYAPGLLGSLLIGTLTARMLAILWHKPFYPVHHLKSHIYANWLHDNKNQHANTPIKEPCTSVPIKISPANATIKKPYTSTPIKKPYVSTTLSSIPQKKEGKESSSPKHLNTSIPEGAELTSEHAVRETRNDGIERHVSGIDGFKCSDSVPTFPLLALVISGGHTQIIYMPEHNHFEIIGTTRDDAVGECFDKAAKILGLPYPGGPSIASCALKGDPNKYQLPHPKIDDLDFSFSGLKTAILRAVQADCQLPITTPSYELASHLTSQQQADFAASFQDTACDILLEKLQLALQDHPEARSLVFAGGVSANQTLRAKAHTAFDDSISIYFPEPRFTGDNAAMVGAAAYYEILSGVPPTDPYALNILPRTPIK